VQRRALSAPSIVPRRAAAEPALLTTNGRSRKRAVPIRQAGHEVPMNDDAPPVALDQDVKRLLDTTPAAASLDSLPLEEARRQVEEQCRYWNRELPAIRAADFEMDGSAGPLRARMMWPSETPRLPLIVYLHGGGWTLGSIDSHQRLMCCLSLETGAALLAIDYRLAPEAPYPQAIEDCMAAVRHARANAEALGIDRSRLVLGGDSAGANLALGALLRLRAQDELAGIRGGALFYGCYRARTDSPSYRAYGGGALRLSSAEMVWFWANYLGPDGAGHPEAEPLLADLADLPPLFVTCGVADPLLDDSRELATKLAEAGAPHEYREYPGLVHGFLQMTLDVAASRRAMAEAGRAIREMIGSG
jgi:acetyl esterase